MYEQVESISSELLNGIQQWMIRQVEPPMMCFEVVCRSIENDWMMPTIYLIQKSIEWQEWVPFNMERLIFEQQFGYSVSNSSFNSNSNVNSNRNRISNSNIDSNSDRTSLLMMIQEEDGEQMYSKAIEKILQAIKKDTKKDHQRRRQYERIRIIPVYVQLTLSTNIHYSTPIRKLKTSGRMVAIRKAEPIILLIDHILQAYEEDPVETLYHLSSRVHASLRFQFPKSMYQLELIDLCRKIYTGTTSHLFSARQIASINEELFQIHVRTRNHPDMQELKTCLREYNEQLKRFSFDMEDLLLSSHPFPMVTSVSIVQVLEQIVKVVIVEMMWTMIKKPGPTRKNQVYLSVVCGVLFFVMWTIWSFGRLLLMTIMVLLIGMLLMKSSTFSSILNTSSSSRRRNTIHIQVDDNVEVSSFNWWRKRFGLFISKKELEDLKTLRQKIQALVFSLVDRYRNTALPVPMVVSTCSATTPTTGIKQYQVNVHHTIVLNLLPSVLVDDCLTLEERRRLIYGPQMLRDDHWRTLYDTVVAASSSSSNHLTFKSLLESKFPFEGLELVKYFQSKSFFFEWVLTAFILLSTKFNSCQSQIEIPSADKMEEMMRTLDEIQVIERKEIIHRILQMT
jgi:hypothetical protein